MLRPSAPAEPLRPLPSARDEVGLEAEPAGPPAPGVPLPPSRSGSAEAAPVVAAALPRAPLGSPPLPGPPDADTPPPVVAPDPQARERDPECRTLARNAAAVAKPLPALIGAGSCGAPLPVELSGVRLRDGSTVAIEPPAILRCGAASALVALVRDDWAPAAARDGATLTEVRTAASYICRGRNNRANAKMSEHGLANAVDVSGVGFKDGRELGIYHKQMPQTLAQTIKPSACARFMTVLGPGSDGYHEDHLHLDLRKRRSAASKVCRWSED
ncbi:extensin family protein [Methylopila turkensis]|nr:extensin family protein [Methylopila turkensis]